MAAPPSPFLHSSVLAPLLLPAQLLPNALRGLPVEVTDFPSRLRHVYSSLSPTFLLLLSSSRIFSHVADLISGSPPCVLVPAFIPPLRLPPNPLSTSYFVSTVIHGPLKFPLAIYLPIIQVTGAGPSLPPSHPIPASQRKGSEGREGRREGQGREERKRRELRKEGRSLTILVPHERSSSRPHR